MAGSAETSEAGSFSSEVVGRPTTFQRELEKLVGGRNRARRRPSVRPGITRALRTRKPDSDLSSGMREKAEAAFVEIRSMTLKQKMEYSDDIKQNDPALFEAMLAVFNEKAPQRYAERDAIRERLNARTAQHEEALALTDQAMLNVTREDKKRLEEILKVPPDMRERVESLLTELQSLAPDQRSAYQEDIEKNDPTLHAAVLLDATEDGEKELERIQEAMEK